MCVQTNTLLCMHMASLLYHGSTFQLGDPVGWPLGLTVENLLGALRGARGAVLAVCIYRQLE